ncbi:hypothetical protein CI109_104307 [Kwoniella shandongensis]|uniref:Uncharacterized protein n=1 Tax=Kwoniella shandongensis TaxID=1734106 RepID=A0AAJ8MXQ1_9TREE
MARSQGGSHPPAPPPKDKSKSHSSNMNATSAPAMIDFFLDTSLIPSLPPPGGKVTHQTLMGRPKLPLSKPILNNGVSRSPSTNAAAVAIFIPASSSLPPRSSSSTLAVPRPGLMKRSSSFEERSRNRAGVGAGTGAVLGRSGSVGEDVRKWSVGSGDTVLDARDHHATREGGKPNLVKRTSSLELPNLRSKVSNDSTPELKAAAKVKRTHTRTASDSTLCDLTQYKRENLPPPRSTSLVKRSGASSLRREDGGENSSKSKSLQTGIQLLRGNSSDRKTVVKLLTALEALIPASRIIEPPPPSPSKGILNPMSLIIPMSLVLEALVYEREVLKGSPPSERLPILRNGSTFHLFSDDAEVGQGELDWTVLRSYMFAMGTIIDIIFPLVQQHRDTEEEMMIRDLIKSIRAYVSKMKKVFGEVATGEVGRWGDLFDA